MIKEALADHAATLDREWQHDRTKSVGASEIGACARKTHWAKTGGEKDSGHVDSWGARVRGTVMEASFWEPALQAKYGKKLLWSGKDQQSIGDKYLSATPDGLVTGLPRDALKSVGVKDIGPSGCILVECKSIDPRVNLVKEKEENAFQVQAQLGLVRKLTDYKPDYALISYTDASFWNEVAEFPVKFDPDIYSHAHHRAQAILTAKHARDLKPEGWIAGGQECEWCPFTKACGIIRRSVPEREKLADPQFVAEVTDACRAIQAIESTIESNQARLREAEQALKDRLREKGVRKIPKVVTWSAVKGRASYDNKGIKEAAVAAGVDIEQFSTVGEPTDRLQITLNASLEP